MGDKRTTTSLPNTTCPTAGETVFGTVFGFDSVLPEPVRDLKAGTNRRHFYCRVDRRCGRGTVFVSKSIRMYGTLVKMSDAESWMTKIVPIENGRKNTVLPFRTVRYNIFIP